MKAHKFIRHAREQARENIIHGRNPKVAMETMEKLEREMFSGRITMETMEVFKREMKDVMDRYDYERVLADMQAKAFQPVPSVSFHQNGRR